MTDRRAILVAAAATVAATMLPFPADARLAFAGEGPRPKRSGQARSFDGLPIIWDSYGDGPVALIFIHGWMCDRSYWTGQIAPFAKRYQVIALDLPGQGASGKARKDWIIDAFGDDVARVAAAAAPGKRIVLVGHSMGGLVVLPAGRRLVDHGLAGIVSVDSLFSGILRPAPTGSAAPPTPSAREFRESTRRIVSQSMFGSQSDPLLSKRVAEAMASGDPAIGTALGRAIGDVDVPAEFKAIEAIPLTIINGTRRPTDIERLRGGHPLTRFALIEGVGHFIMLDDPQAFNAILATEILAMTGRITLS